jgi:hypothetical protein
MNRNLCTLVIFAACVGVVPFEASANDAQAVAAATVSEAECVGATHLSPIQGRIADLATQGLVPLRAFILRTRAVYQLDLMETVGWLDQRRALLAACERRAAGASPVTAVR